MNTRGGLLICCNGYMYTKKLERKTCIRWECSQRRSLNCKGAVTTDASTENITSLCAHKHDGDFSKVEAMKIKATMKKHAAATRGKPSQILADAAVSAPVEVRAALGNTETIKRVIRNHKRGALPKDPTSLHDLTISEKWSKFEGKDFLIHDNGFEAANRVLVFGAN